MAIGLSLLGLPLAGAQAMNVYGGLRGLPGGGGCVRDVSRQAPSERRCAGAAAGLQGAAALALSPDGRNLYVASPRSGAVVALDRNRRSGALRPPLAPTGRDCVQAGGGGCARSDPALRGVDALAVSADGRFLYAGAADSASVSAFARGRAGLLSALPRTIGRGRAGFGCVAGNVLAGSPPPGCGAQQNALSGVSALAVSPDGRDVYAVSFGGQPGQDSIVVLARNPRSGGLSPVRGPGGCVQSRPARDCSASAAGLEGADAVTISPDGRYVYVAAPISGAVVAFARNGANGRLAALRGSGGCVSATGQAAPERDVPCVAKAAGLGGARALALSPDGRELYVAAFDPGAVVALARDPSNGRIGPLAGPGLCLQAVADATCPAGLTALHQASSVALSPNGRLVYVASEAADSVIELLRDPADGRLALTTASARSDPSLSGPQALAASRDGRDLYLASPFDDAVAGLGV